MSNYLEDVANVFTEVDRKESESLPKTTNIITDKKHDYFSPLRNSNENAKATFVKLAYAGPIIGSTIACINSLAWIKSTTSMHAKAGQSSNLTGEKDKAPPYFNPEGLTAKEWIKLSHKSIVKTLTKYMPGETATKTAIGLGMGMSLYGIVSSSIAYDKADKKYRSESNKFGPDNDRALNARREFSSAELGMVIPSPFKELIKLFGGWDDLVTDFERYKYGDGRIAFNPFKPPRAGEPN